MAKNDKIKKINYTKKDLLSWEEIDQFCKEDEMLNLFVDDFKKLFEENFYLSDEETRKYISMIIVNCNGGKIEQISSIVQSLADLDKDTKKFFAGEGGLLSLVYQPKIFEELGQEPITGKTEQERKAEILKRIDNFTEDDKKRFLERLSKVNIAERRQEARKMVRKLIKFAINTPQNDQSALPKDFYPILKQAKLLGIDPIKWVTLTNLDGMTLAKFDTMIHGLVGEEYKNPFHGKNAAEPETFTLFSTQDMAEVLQVSTLLSLFKPNYVQTLIDVIGRTLKEYDKATSKDLIEFFKTYPTILLQKPVTIAENISALEKRFVETGHLTKAELAQEIIKKPSIVSCDPDKVDNFEELYSVVLTELIEDNGLVVEPDYVKKQVEKVCYDFKQLDKINALKSEKINNLDLIRDVLVSAVGAKNALTLMGDFNILNANPKYVDYIFKAAKYIQAQHPKGKDLISYIATNTAQFFGRVEENDAIEKMHDVVDGEPKKERKPRTHTAIQKPSETTSPEFEEVQSALRRLPADEKARAEATLLALIEFAQEEPEKPKTSFERADAISDERIQELMREAEVECVNDDDPFVEFLTRFRNIYDEQNGEGAANKLLNIDALIHEHEVFVLQMDSFDFQLACEFASHLDLVYSILRANIYDDYDYKVGVLMNSLEFAEAHYKEVVDDIQHLFNGLSVYSAAKNVLQSVDLRNGKHPVPSKMDIAEAITTAKILKYFDIYFPERKELILPKELQDKLFAQPQFDDKYIKMCSAFYSIYTGMSDYLNHATAQMKNTDIASALKKFSVIDSPASIRSFVQMMSSVDHSEFSLTEIQHRLSTIFRSFVSVKNFKDVFNRCFKHSADYVTDAGYVIGKSFVPCDEQELKNFRRAGIPVRANLDSDVTIISDRKEETDYSSTLEVAKEIVQHLAREDRNLSGGDGSGK